MKNFGKIKNAFNDLLAESVGGKGSSVIKKQFKDYVKAIKESEILRSQFIIYTNIENRVDDCPYSAVNFISENVNILRKYKPEQIIEENKKLLSLSDKISKKINESYNNSEVDEALSNLICTERTPRNLNDLSNNLKTVVNHIKQNKERKVDESIDLPQSLLVNMMVDKFNDRYSFLSESEKKVVKSIIESDLKQKEEIYKKIINECIQLIDDKYDTVNVESKEKLLKTKCKLINDMQGVINEDEFNTTISKLIELKNGLETN